MNRFLLFILFSWYNTMTVLAQNVGINNTAPAFPLSFSNTWGTKISLWGDAYAHYGIAARPSMMQFFTDIPSVNIGFGYGTTDNFNERMRIINGGIDGMQLNGRIVLRNGSSPLNLSAGPGVWLSRPDNSSLGGFMGVQNNTNIGFYGAGAGWGLVYNVDNGRVGLGTATPVNRLDIAGLNNWDLTNTEGDVRIGNDNHRLKFGVALQGGGSGAASIMQSGGVGLLTLGANSKNLVQLNGGNNSLDLLNLSGGLRLNGNAGTAGQVLQSNGAASAPSWVTRPAAPYVLTYNQSSQYWQLFGAGVLSVDGPGLHDQYFTLATPATLVFTISGRFSSGNYVTTSFAYLQIIILNAFNQSVGVAKAYGSSIDTRFNTVQAIGTATLPAGVYHTQVRCHRKSDLDGDMNVGDGIVVIQVIPN